MECTKCGLDWPDFEFRLKKYNGKFVRSTVCRECERMNCRIYHAAIRRDARRLKRQDAAAVNPGSHDRHDWWHQRRPWPWPPGMKVFEDIKLKRT